MELSSKDIISLRDILRRRPVFASNESLLSFISLSEISFLADQLALHATSSVNLRIETSLSFLKDKYLANGKSALLIFLTTLYNTVSEHDADKIKLRAAISNLSEGVKNNQESKSENFAPKNKALIPLKEELLQMVSENNLAGVIQKLEGSISHDSIHYTIFSQFSPRLKEIIDLNLSETENPRNILFFKNKFRMDLVAFINSISTLD